MRFHMTELADQKRTGITGSHKCVKCLRCILNSLPKEEDLLVVCKWCGTDEDGGWLIPFFCLHVVSDYF